MHLVDLRSTVGARVVRLVEPTPFEAAHLPVWRAYEDRADPVDHRRKVGLQALDVGVHAVLCEVGVDGLTLGGRDPFERLLQDFLALRITPHVGLPLLHVRVVRVRVLRLGRSDERTGVDRVEQLLLVEWDAGDVNRVEPLFDLRLRTFAVVDK